MADARTTLAYLMWCWNEGYVTPEDRAIVPNWLLLPDDQLMLHDAQDRENLLAMADEVLAALAAETSGG